MSTTNSPRTSRKRERARAEILDAAREVVRELGVGGMTIDAVAERADVSKPAVYYYFQSKDDLIRRLALEDTAVECRAVRDAIDQAAPGPAVLTDFVRAFVRHYADDLQVFKVGYVWGQVVGLDPTEVDTTVNSAMNDLFTRLEARLEEEKRAGRLRSSVHVRRLAVAAWMSALGLVSTLSICDSAGQRLLHPTDAVLETLCDALAFGAFVSES